jgi:hypothetical protein
MIITVPNNHKDNNKNKMMRSNSKVSSSMKLIIQNIMQVI